MKFVEKIKKNWKKILISAGILGCGILLGYYVCDGKKNLEKTEEDNNNYNNYNYNYNYNNKHNNYKHNKNKKK